MGNISQKVIEPFRIIGQLLDLILRIADHLRPLIDDGLGKPADHENEDQMQRDPRDHQVVELLSLICHRRKVICHGGIVCDLA